MGRVVCFANQKGGVGKTSTCVNLCAAIREKNRPILLVDADPQGNATTGMGVNKHEVASLYDVLINGMPAEEAIVSTPYGDVIPANIDLSAAEVGVVVGASAGTVWTRLNRVRAKLRPDPVV